MKDSVASMISNKAVFTARRPDKAKHQPKVRNVVMMESKVGATVSVKRREFQHTVWRDGREWVVTKGGLVPI